jgi:RNA polymerase sigma-70 factor (ECF subfamily)
MMQAHSNTPQPRTDLAFLFEQYASGILAYVRMHTHSLEDAEDIVVDVFLAALENAHFASLGEREQLLWLWRVARNKTIDAYRYKKRRTYVALEDVEERLYEPDSHDPELMALQHEDLAAIQLYLRQLPTQQQEVLRLRFGQELSCNEIATRLGKQENAVRVTLSRGLNLLRRIYSRGKGESA